MNNKVITENMEKLSNINKKIQQTPKSNQISFNMIDKSFLFQNFNAYQEEKEFELTDEIKNKFRQKMANFQCV